MELEESRLKFKFEEEIWLVVRYDGEGFYRKKLLSAIPRTLASDFIGIYQEQEIVFFEIKNFRGYRREKSVKKRLNDDAEKLAQKIAKKVRDTLAGIIGANRNTEGDDKFWEQALTILSNPKRNVTVIAWIEEDILPGRDEKNEKVKLSTRRSKLKQKLAWLTPRVYYHNKNHSPNYSGFSCEFIAGS